MGHLRIPWTPGPQLYSEGLWNIDRHGTNLTPRGTMFHKVGTMAEKAHHMRSAKCKSIVNRTQNVTSLIDVVVQADVIRKRRSLSNPDLMP